MSRKGFEQMATGKFVAYYRVSTGKQAKSGLGIEAQQQAVRSYLNGGNWQLVAEHTEIESGKVNNRPQLQEALRQCRITGAKLIVAKLDRLSRNVAFLAELQDGKVPFIAADMPEANELTIHIMAAVAQAERKAISKRTVDALAAAKARGVKLGGAREGAPPPPAPSLGAAASVASRKATANELAKNLSPTIADLRKRGVTSLREIAAVLTDRQIKTPRGGDKWQAGQVRRLLERIDGVTKQVPLQQ